MGKDEILRGGLFWDIDPSCLDLQENKDYIIERILELGDQEALIWLFSTYAQSDIKRVLSKSRRISRKSFNYWSLVLNP